MSEQVYAQLSVSGATFSLPGPYFIVRYLSLPPTRQDLTLGQMPERRLKWE